MKKVLRVFRVVDSNGDGMYSGNLPYFDEECGVEIHRSLWCAACMRNEYSPVHPAPFEDGISDFDSSWLFGFQSMDALQKWIYKTVWIDNMTALGGRVICFVVEGEDNFIVGGRQCVFDPRAAKEEYSLPVKEAIAFEESRNV